MLGECVLEPSDERKGEREGGRENQLLSHMPSVLGCAEEILPSLQLVGPATARGADDLAAWLIPH